MTHSFASEVVGLEVGVMELSRPQSVCLARDDLFKLYF